MKIYDDVIDLYGPDGKIIEEIGTYNPMVEPSELKLDNEKVEKWLKNGAKPTDTVKRLIENNK